MTELRCLLTLLCTGTKSNKFPGDLNEVAGTIHPGPVDLIPLMLDNPRVLVAKPYHRSAPLLNPGVMMQLAHTHVPLRPQPILIPGQALKAALPVIKNSILCLFQALKSYLPAPL